MKSMKLNYRKQIMKLKGMKVTEQLAEQFKQADEDMRLHMVDALEHYVGEFKRADREQEPSAGGRAAGVHDAMTIWIDAAAAKPAVQCQRGCAHCCRLMVSVLPDEATLMLMASREAGLALDLDRLERQAEATTVEEWRLLPHADRACVFLRNEECAIHEHRPNACRKYFVATPRELCDTQRFDGGKVGILASAMAEIIASAAISTWGQEGMAAALLKALDEPTMQARL